MADQDQDAPRPVEPTPGADPAIAREIAEVVKRGSQVLPSVDFGPEWQPPIANAPLPPSATNSGTGEDQQ
jgi:hypothetical protein